MTDTTSTDGRGPDRPGWTGAARGRRWKPWPVVALAVAVAVLVGGGVFGTLAVSHRNGRAASAAIRASGLPPDVPTPLADLMSLSTVPHRQAPAFDLTDQSGRRLSLSSFRGRVVVLEFMDSHCHDICPLVSEELVHAYHDLGKTAEHVAFVAVNANPYFNKPADVAAFSREHGLDAIPSWRYLTGPVPELKRTWRAYGVTVGGSRSNVIHSSLVYFIGADGTERYLASPNADHTRSGVAYLPPGQLGRWGRGIALVARDLAG